MTSIPPEPPVERPLSGAAKLALIASAAGTIALFYLFLTAVIPLLLIWACLLILCIMALARFGLSGLIMKSVQRDFTLIGLLARSLWLRRGTQYRLKLHPAEAPGIMAIMRKLCARLQIPEPDAVYLEMSAGAWVELRGLRRNLGQTNIGIGYDLLAGLTAQEVEAVLAHELAHAKLINRAFKNWLGSGLGRAATLSNRLSTFADAHRRAGNSFTLAELILRIADALTRCCARLVSAYSRQDEFEADRGAAELCGSAPLRSALQRLEILPGRLERFPWNERLAQIQSEAGLSSWLVHELAGPAKDEATSGPAVFNHYSTHPAMPDRLAALTEDGSQLEASPPGISLLADPDAVARKLVREIERVLLEAEKKDRKEQRRWLRQIRSSGGIRFRAAQLPGLGLLLIGSVFGFASLAATAWYFSLLAVGLSIGVGLWLIHMGGGYRDRQPLPRPTYAALKAAWSNPPDRKNSVEAEKQLEKTFRESVAGERRKKNKAAQLGQEAYAALAQCDYFRAHVAARLGREFQADSVECTLALMIASAAFHQETQTNAMLQAVVKSTSLRSAATAWAAAWATILLGAWLPAEALLHETMKRQPADPTLVGLLALAQSRRNKLQSALATLRPACVPPAASPEHVKLLIEILLTHGDLLEAGLGLQQLDHKERASHEVQFSWIRLHLLQRDFARAEQWISDMEATGLPGYHLVSIGQLYDHARNDEKAAAFFERAIATGHYPEARLCLAQQRAKAGDHAKAREHALASLDTVRPLGEKATSPYQIFPAALAQLVSLEGPSADCKAWIGTVPAGQDAGPLAKRALMIYAPTEAAAGRHLQVIVLATEPTKPPVSPARFNIKPAPRDLQPAQPVRPGVQYVYN